MNKNYEDYPMILSAEDVADILKVSKSTAYALCVLLYAFWLTALGLCIPYGTP